MTGSLSAPEALLIGPANCQVTLGVPWRWLRDHAAELGVDVHRVGRKPIVDAQAARTALLTRATRSTPVAVPAEDDIDSLRRQLGLRRKN